MKTGCFAKHLSSFAEHEGDDAYFRYRRRKDVVTLKLDDVCFPAGARYASTAEIKAQTRQAFTADRNSGQPDLRAKIS
jgi:hypothetical protein